MPRQVDVQSSIRFKAYSIIEQAIDHGMELGWNRAHKHTDTPSKEQIIECMGVAVMESLTDVVDFE